jgi:hypothetical protein
MDRAISAPQTGPVLAAIALLLSGGLLLIAGAAGLHHSLMAEFDPERMVELTGVVARVQWANPHPHIYMDVENQAGEVERWIWQLASPNGLERQGWSATTVRVGDQITASGTPARDGSRKANTLSVRLEDGKRLSASLADPAAH